MSRKKAQRSQKQLTGMTDVTYHLSRSNSAELLSLRLFAPLTGR